MTGVTSVEKLIFAMRHRVILDAAAPRGDGAAAARQLDVVLMQAGFKASAGLLAALSRLEAGYVIDQALTLIGWARELAGDHVRHNTYFTDFPANVPVTVEFWAGLLAEAAAEYARTGEAAPEMAGGPDGGLYLNLLALPGYGRYQHSWEEMLARHEDFTAALSDRVTVLHLGGSPEQEGGALYADLAGSTVPLSGAGLDALRVLAEARIGFDQPPIAVRENRAVVGAARIRAGAAPLAGTVTDVLRLAAELSGGDVTLAQPARFTSMPRAWRRLLLRELDALVAGREARLADVPRHAEAWKRLGERLHPHEAGLASASRVFAVARGEERVPAVAARAQLAFARGDAQAAARELAAAPGMLWRAADQVLRTAGAATPLLRYFEATAGQVSGRVLLSVREHLANREGRDRLPRVFANRAGGAWVAPDTRAPVDRGLLAELLAVIDAEVGGRLADPGRVLVADPVLLGAALPLSGRAAPEGLGVWPRGSVTPVGGDLLRFFVYWRQAGRRTDFDLSAVFTDRQFGGGSHVSYTSLRNGAAVHSGDITEAPGPDGASEFIDVDLAKAGLGYVIPQVYVFAGEGFDEVDEGFFGFMTRGQAQRGAPFEPRTVRMKSALSGPGRVAMPVAFYRGDTGGWYAKWLHLQLRGRSESFGGVRVEENRVTTALLARGIMSRDYLRVSYLVDLLRARAGAGAQQRAGRPVTWIGIDQPEEVLPKGSSVITLGNLASLIPA